MQRPTDNLMIPKIFQSVVNQLNTRCIREDGILRLAGQKQKLEFLCNEIESKFFTNRTEIETLLQQATVHELTGVLKKLLRDLPDPIFTMELFDMFYKTSRKSQRKMLQSYSGSLKDHHFTLLHPKNIFFSVIWCVFSRSFE